MDLATFLGRQYRYDIAFHRYMLDAVLFGLTVDELNWQAGQGHHSIWHHVWHMFLSKDYYFAGALGTPPVWEEGHWADRFDQSPMARAFDYPSNAEGGVVPRFVIADVPDSLVDELKALPLATFLGYVDAMFASTTVSLGAASEEQLKRPFDLYGITTVPTFVAALGFSHIARHIGMIEDLRGLIRGPGQGTASI